jgi:hypothetical protein
MKYYYDLYRVMDSKLKEKHADVRADSKACSWIVWDKCLYLVNVIIPREAWLTQDQLSENTPDAPDINRLGILVACKHDFGSTVPASHNIFG